MRGGWFCGVALLIATGTALAQPSKHDSAKPVRPNGKAAEVVLAAAETVRPPMPGTAVSEAPKRPLPRITHCRCGDPDPGVDAPDQ